MITHAQVLDALAGVRDPELDEPLTDLGFVTDVVIDGDAVAVRLRLPTYFCAPNFAYLMVADARAALLGVSGAGSVRIELEDHFAAPEINAAVEADSGFAGAFPDETEGGLESLRTLFQGKALTARQGRLGDQLIAAGHSLHEIADMRVGDVPHGADLERCIELRRALGIAAGAGDPAIVLPKRRRTDPAQLERYLRIARLMRVSLEGNAGLCRSLLQTRYGIDAAERERSAVVEAVRHDDVERLRGDARPQRRAGLELAVDLHALRGLAVERDVRSAEDPRVGKRVVEPGEIACQDANEL